MRSCLVAVLLLASGALAQEASPPPVLPAEEPTGAVAPPGAPLAVVEPTLWERCFAIPGQAWSPAPGGRYVYVGPGRGPGSAPLGSSPRGRGEVHAAAPVGQAPAAGGAPGRSSGGGDSVDGKALLVLAVVLVAALPVVVYVIDSEAPPEVDTRFRCPSFGLEAYGGLDTGGPVAGMAGVGAGRVSFGYSFFGADFDFALAPGSITSWGGHLMLRFAPKAHIEPSIAFGFRALSLGGVVRQGFEVGVPHRYVFWRDNLRQLALELRPSLVFGLGTLDAGLEVALHMPLVEPVQARLGGRVLSFGDTVLGGVNFGLTLNL